VRYEDLTSAPQQTLDRIAAFIEQPLVHEEILRAGVGSVSKPNTSFPGQTSTFQGRWKAELPDSRARSLEAMLAPVLERQGDDVDPAITGGRTPAGRDDSGRIPGMVWHASGAEANAARQATGLARIVRTGSRQARLVRHGGDLAGNRAPPAASAIGGAFSCSSALRSDYNTGNRLSHQRSNLGGQRGH